MRNRRARAGCDHVAVRMTAVCALAIASGALTAAAPAAAESPGQYCGAAGTNDSLRPIPQPLVSTARKLFDLGAMPESQIRRSTWLRCDRGRALLCNEGANLPCGKANTRRDLPATEQWCKVHPNSDFIPAYVTGHDTIYAWKCSGTTAAITATVFQTDRRGFISQFWKRIP